MDGKRVSQACEFTSAVTTLFSRDLMTRPLSGGVPYGTGERTSTGVSSANEARTACYVLYRVRQRWLQHEGRKRALLQNERRTALQRH